MHAPCSSCQVAAAVQGSAHLFSTLQADLTQHMQRFEQAALRDSLSVPPGLLHPSALPSPPAIPHTPEDEQRADAQLAELRHKIKQVRCRCVLSASGLMPALDCCECIAWMHLSHMWLPAS